jgi:hypothetical protein
MSTTLVWILGIIAFLLVFGLFVLLDIRIAVKDIKEPEPERDNKPYYVLCYYLYWVWIRI